MCLKVNITGFEMPMYTTHAINCVNIISFEMLMYITNVISLLQKAKEGVLSHSSPSWWLDNDTILAGVK